jgi:type I restriction enzyme S subunit
MAKVGDISRVGRSTASTLSTANHFVDDADLATLKMQPVPEGSVLFAKIGEAIRQNHRVIAGRPLLIDNNAMAAVPTSPDLDGRYLFRFLQSIDFYALSSATTVPSLRKSDLQRIEMPFPGLDDQRRISGILDHADALRAKRRQVIEHLDTLTQSIFHNLFSSSSYPEVRAGDLMPRMRNGLSPATAGVYPAQVLTLSAVTQGAFDPGAVKSGLFAIDPPHDKRVSALDFMMCRGNGNKSLVGIGAYSTEDRSDLVFPDTVIAGRVDTSKVAIQFLNTVWKQRAVRSQIESLARTTNGTYKVNQQTLSGVAVPLPPLDLQLEFARRNEAVQTERHTLLAAQRDLDELFGSLQSRAFGGGL